jgi:hypothetical protein|tara:strand:- start:60 stop:239 length:180 start_codon:yes stop_codon:yes gene_type:complete
MVTAIYETNNCRTWISGRPSEVKSNLTKIERDAPETFKLIRMDKGDTTTPKVILSKGLY